MSITYACGDLYGWWDRISGRQDIIDGYTRLISGEGYPGGWIYKDEKCFFHLYKFIIHNTENKEVLALENLGIKPSLITIDGGGIKKWSVPEDWPDSSSTAPEAQILLGYPQEPEKIREIKKITWAGQVSDLNIWIDNARNKERFWVSIVLVTVLSIILSIAELPTDKKIQMVKHAVYSKFIGRLNIWRRQIIFRRNRRNPK
ncbi:MAG: hypothetical protein V1848_01720 [Candidatus Magasanikbacteria bacterium]